MNNYKAGTPAPAGRRRGNDGMDKDLCAVYAAAPGAFPSGRKGHKKSGEKFPALQNTFQAYTL